MNEFWKQQLPFIILMLLVFFALGGSYYRTLTLNDVAIIDSSEEEFEEADPLGEYGELEPDEVEPEPASTLPKMDGEPADDV